MFPTYVQDIIVHRNSYLAPLTTHPILVSEPSLFSLSFKDCGKIPLNRLKHGTRTSSK